MNTKRTLAVEAISFQGAALFEGVTSAIVRLRSALRERAKDEEIDQAMQGLVDVVKRVTNLSLGMLVTVDSRYDFCMLSPYVRNSHIFDVVQGEYFLASGASDDLYQKTLGDKGLVVRGSVDMRKNRVEGFFAELPFTLIVPASDLISALLSDQEIAAIVLHELGHAFTACEYLNRTMSANQVLADIAQAYAQGPDKIGVVLARVTKEQNLTSQQQKLLASAKKPEDYVVCVYAVADEKCRSELGLSVYDTTSCEQLADQYATRCGAGRHLVTAMDKYYRYYDWSYGQAPLASISRALFMHAAYSALSSAYFLFAAPLVGLGFMAFVLTVKLADDTKNSIQYLDSARYDDLYQRFERIYHQLVQRIKSEKIDPKALRVLLVEIEEVNKTLEPLREAEVGGKTHQLGHYLALFFSGSYRQKFDLEMLQRELEALANNNLFVQAAKLKTV